MKHFNITQWADSVRGLASDIDQKRMRIHLETGCSRCGDLVTALERVATLARADAQTAPPDYALRSIKAYFRLNQPGRQSWLSTIALGLTPHVAANNRSDNGVVKQLAYASDEYTLDLTLDPAEVGSDAAIAGYCLRQAGNPVAGAPVFLICNGQFAGQGTTGELGEFHFETELVDPMELWLFDESDLPVAVSLDLAEAA